MDSIEELLPGIEEFLAGTLASEGLSSFAEERRQFFLERLDIVKLPPSVPPREGRGLSTQLSKDTEVDNGIPVSSEAPDFAATQREISRSFLEASTSQDLNTNGSLCNVVKVYDDIDDIDSRQEQSINRQRAASQDSTRLVDNSKDDNNENDYETPVIKPLFSADDNSISNATDASSLATEGSTEELQDETRSVSPKFSTTPLIPRKDTTHSDPGIRYSLEVEKPPELPYRPPLPKRHEIYSTTEKSDRSETEKSITSEAEPELSGDGDSTSYESFEDDNDQENNEKSNTFSVPLPKKPMKKSTLRSSRNRNKSCSPSRWEINVPFRKLNNIEISGELHHKGKLKWNRRIGAITEGCLLLYKPEKDVRPLLVLPLEGYEASLGEKEGKKGYEVKMVHSNDDPYTFSVDFKEWALHWIEHINGNSKKQPPTKYHTHLARSYSEGADFNLAGNTDGSKNDLTGSNSNVSTEDGSQENSKNKTKNNKIMRVGSFAYRASQFFENIGKKTTGGKKTRDSSVPSFRHSSGETPEPSRSVQASLSSGNIAKDQLSPASDSSSISVFSGSNRGASLPPTPCDSDLGTPWEPASDGIEAPDVTCKGYLSIFSNFNHRRWGRRWCQIKHNMFECYRSENSHPCELYFLLRSCIMRRAMVETKSSNGLMILEGEKEKITVETLSNDELRLWVQALFKEMENKEIPEGLEEYLLLQQDYRSCELDSFTGRNLSVHDYEDPEETVAAAAKLKISNQSTHDILLPTAERCGSEICSDFINAQNSIEEILPMSTSKQITDSGFYSVKGANSDSDSSCEIASHNVIRVNLDSEQELARSPRNAGKQSVRSNSKRSSLSKSTIGKSLSSQIILPLSSPSNKTNSEFASSRLKESTSRIPSVSTSHNHVHKTHQKKDTSIKRNLKSSNIDNHPSNTASKPPDSASSSTKPSKTDIKSGSSIKSTKPSTPDSKSGSSTSSNQTVILSTGDEYSVILKRSERSSKVQSLSVFSKTSSSDLNSKTIEQLFDDVFTESINDKRGQISSTGEQNVFHNQSTKTVISKSAHSEVSTQIQTSSKTTQITNNNVLILNNNNNNNIPTSNDKGFDEDQLPPLPSSPVPNSTNTSPSFLCDDKNMEPNKIFSNDVLHTSTEQSKSLNNEMSETSKVDELTPNSEGDTPMSTFSENVMAIINKSNSTPGEIRKVIDSLKIRQAVNKRRRMAVHDKRQRVLSDGERLACEKEFATLEKVGESIEKNIRVLQNHLDKIQGKTMEGMKAANSNQTTGSKSKKSKKMATKGNQT